METYTQRMGFDVLTAPLSAVDRRALSEAWYSALHLGAKNLENGGARTSSHCAREVVFRHANAHGALAAQDDTGKSGSASKGASRDRLGTADSAPCVERRSARDPLARKIELKFLQPRPHAHKTVTIVHGRDRVQLLVRATRSNAEIVAICAPHLRERVARALEQARYGLARQGITSAAQAREVGS